MNMLTKLYSKIKKRRREIRQLQLFKQDFEKFYSLNSRTDLSLSWSNRLPKLHDRSSDTPFDAHYIYHPAWAARVIKSIEVGKHVDFSSSLHFCTILSAFVPTEFYDYRPANISLSNLESKPADLTKLNFENRSIGSLSCLHTIEHIGLGRYGDPIDPDGDLKAIAELQRVGNDHILIVVPVGKPKVVFNAHRIYDPVEFVNLFNQCRLDSFSFVDDNGGFHMSASVNDAVGQSYACGCYHFRKIEQSK